MSLRKNLQQCIALNNYVEALRSNILSDSNKVYLEDSIKDGLSSLNVYGKVIQSNIPEGYTKLEYIQSNGASYLIVPYRVNNKTVFYCRYNETQKGLQTASAVFGVTDTPDVAKANYGILRLLDGVSSFNRMGWGDSTSGSVININAPQDLDTWYEVLYDQNELYQDNVLYATSATSNDTEWVANYDLGIFARNGSSVTMPAIAKISSVWAKENSEYKINLVPAKRNSDNVIGMYDLVSGQFFTNAGTGDFIAGPTVTPTPENPLDICCNNGVLKPKAIVPTGYTPLDKITNAASTRIRTSIIPDIDDMEFEIQVNHPATGSWYILQARYDQNSSVYGISGSNSGNTFLGGWSGSSARATNIARDSAHNYYIRFIVKNGNSTLYIRDLTTNEEETVQNSYTYTSLSEPICIFANTAGNTVSSGNELVFAKIYKSGQLVLDCVPASDGNNNVGVYDRVSQTLLVPEIGGVIAGNPIDNIKITVEGNPEVLTVKGNNLYDEDTRVENYAIDDSGQIVSSSGISCYSEVIPVNPGDILTVSWIKNYNQQETVRLHAYNSNKTWLSEICNLSTTGSVGKGLYMIGTTPANCKYVRISIPMIDSSVQVEKSPRPTKYCEYSSSDLSVQDLFGIGDYQDIQSILNGIVTKNVGVLVLDGSISWTYKSLGNGIARVYIAPERPGDTDLALCSHAALTSISNRIRPENPNTFQFGIIASSDTPYLGFKLNESEFADAIAWKNFLADQYANGTPVIIIYPLATPTTEFVAKQSVNITSNTNAVERNSENISGLKVEATYKKLR